MSLTRWRKERDMPATVAHGKHDLFRVFRWVWVWRNQLEQSLEEAATLQKSGPTADRMDQIKLEMAEIALAKEKRLLVDRREYEEAEAGRITLAVATLQTLPDRLIMAGLMPEASRQAALNFLGEAVDALQAQINADETQDNTGIL